MLKPWSITAFQPAACRSEWVGRKAAQLAYLKSKGVRVPDFIVLPTYTCKKYQSDPHSALFAKRLLRTIRHFILSQPAVGQIAVRSSATAEDSDRFSFAGQFTSILHLTDPNQVAQAVNQVIQSSLPQKGCKYPGANISGCNDMAVIIQQMVPAKLAGVLFTQAPTSATEQMLVEYVHGTGEELMRGSVEPLRYSIPRTAEPAHDEETFSANRISVTPKLIGELAQVGRFIETLFGRPQDIEWAIDEQDQLWILQSRPITKMVCLEQHRRDQRGRMYTNYFFAERFSGPVSPLGWSLICSNLEKNAFREPLWFLGQDRLAKQRPLTALFSGHPYTRVEVFQTLYSVIPLRFISEDKKWALGLTARKQVWWVQLLYALPFLLTRLIGQNLDWLPFFHLHKWHIFSSSCTTRLKVIDDKIKSKPSYYGLLALLNETKELGDLFLSLHRWSITFADLYYELLLKYITILQMSEAENPVLLLQKLLAGLPGNQTVQANHHLAGMAENDPNGSNSTKVWDEFFALFGHRSESLDIYHPTWAESRDFIIAFVQHIRQSSEKASTQVLPYAQKSRIHTEQWCDRQLATVRPRSRAWLNKSAFKYLLSRAQNFTLLRENQRDLWHQILARSRAIALLLAKELVDSGILAKAEEVFFLTCEELHSCHTAQLGNALGEKIAQRQADFKSWTENVDSIDQKGEGGTGALLLHGMAVSRGKVVGRAHIAATYEQALAAEKRAILVAPSIDPAWTPVFHQISGLVLEVGGVLSHASILAREFGIPSVTSVTAAARIIRQGDLIKVDGDMGVVHIIREQT